MSTHVTAPDAISPRVLAALQDAAHEQLLIRRGDRTGLYTIVAIHSTALGPSLGGCRMWRYPDLEHAVNDALRLSGAMTLKASAAGLALGGGKGVVWLPDGLELSTALRHELLRDFADTVNALGGRYITAEDVGTSSEDMAILARFCDHVVGRPTQAGGSGDPGTFTAAGVHASMRACSAHRFGDADLRGRSVAIVGLGSVGADLARRLAQDGALLQVSDIDPRKVELARDLEAQWLEPGDALCADVDILAPCALGGILDEHQVDALGCRVVCGAANNQLADDTMAERLMARGILFAPDFIANSGGLINVSLELDGYDAALAARRCEEIEAVLGRVLTHARDTAVTPLQAAKELAQRRLSVGRTVAGSAGPSGVDV